MIKKLGKIVATTVLVEGLKIAVKAMSDTIQGAYDESYRNRHYSFTVSSETPEMYTATLEWLGQLDFNITERHVLCEAAGSSRNDAGNHSFPVGVFNYKLGRTKLVITKQIDKEHKYDRQTIIKICFFGEDSKRTFFSVKKFVEDKCNIGRVQVNRLHSYSSSRNSKAKRSIDSIVMSDENKKDLLDHLNTFIDMKDVYAEAGIPYKTGILLYGPPGTGKTSLTLAIASHMDYDITYVTPASVQQDAHVLGEIKPKSVIVFEDFDKFFSVTPSKKKTNESQPTMVVETDNADQKKIQFLLSFLDGFASPEECIFVMSTNFPENIDPTLLREGRVDFRMLMPLFSKDLAYKMGKNFGATQAYINKLPKSVWSVPSKLQSNLLKLVKSRRKA